MIHGGEVAAGCPAAGARAWRARDPRLVAEAVKLADHWRDLPQSVLAAVVIAAALSLLKLFPIGASDKLLRRLAAALEQRRTVR